MTGKRALKFKRKNPDLKIDKLISIIMIFTGVLMILLPVIITNHLQKVTIKTTKGDLDYLSGNMSQLVIEYKKRSKTFVE